jgi:hypothetical protein
LPSLEGGRREHRMLAAPAASCARVESTRVGNYRHRRTCRRSLRNGFRLMCLLPCVRAFLATVAGGKASADLIPASGDQDHTTSASASATLVSRDSCVRRIPQRS